MYDLGQNMNALDDEAVAVWLEWLAQRRAAPLEALLA